MKNNYDFFNESYDCFKDSYDRNKDRDRKCKHTIKKPIDIQTPVKLEPSVTVGRISTECAKPEISRQYNSQNNSRCEGGNRACEFVIKQTIYVEIPICYDVDSDIGPSYVDCRDYTPEPDC